MVTTMLLQQGQQRQLEDSNNARATTQLQIKGNDTIVMRATKLSSQWQGHLRLTTATTPSLRGQQFQS
jgi:hypothetical protein